ncbi:MAG: hypothetical protein M0R17_01330 [Candidatus Omnitrophica bacterium]|jgi:hypothetical protein|nr:hypothetical protein [Candidatus Omnitrophota bacterium]
MVGNTDIIKISKKDLSRLIYEAYKSGWDNSNDNRDEFYGMNYYPPIKGINDFFNESKICEKLKYLLKNNKGIVT